MKKLKFNEGGQPIYLDDLATMQSSLSEALCGLVTALLTSDWSVRNITTAFLSDPTKTVNSAYVSGWVYYDGDLLQYTNGLTYASPAPTGYLNIYSAEGDVRTMADGTTRTCSVTKYATVDSAADANALASMEWRSVPIMTELVSDVQWKSDYITLQNGYTGVCRWAHNSLAADVRILASLSSENTTWADSAHMVVRFSADLWSFIDAKKCVQIYNGAGQFFRVYYNRAAYALCVDCAEGMTPADCPMQFIESFY